MSMRFPAFLLCLFATAVIAQGQSTPVSVDLIPHWKAGERHTVRFASKTTDTKGAQKEIFSSRYEAVFLVKEMSDSGCTLEWTYTSCLPGANEIAIENLLIAKLLRTPLLIRLTADGGFERLLNPEAVRTVINKGVVEITAKYAGNKTISGQLELARKLFETDKGLEVGLLKQIKFYHLFYGYRYTKDEPATNAAQFPNPLGGAPLEAEETVRLTKIDSLTKICVIENKKLVNADALRGELISTLQKAYPEQAAAIEREMNASSLEMSEQVVQEIDYGRSLLRKGSHRRTMQISVLDRVTELVVTPVDQISK